jgi:MoxR-like ATPase
MGFQDPRPFGGATMSFREAAEKVEAVLKIANGQVIGQHAVVRTSLASMIGGRHVLFQGDPGLAKTFLTETFAAALGLTTKVVPCTADTMPADILGKEELTDDPERAGSARWKFIPGPVFSQLLLMDELNRANGRVTAALLQAMQKGYVTVNGQTLPLPKPFLTLATQNPDDANTYPLSPALKDRFAVSIDLDSISDEDQEKLFRLKYGNDGDYYKPIEPQLSSITNASGEVIGHQFQLIQQIAKERPIADPVMNYILGIARKARVGHPTSPQYIRDHFHSSVKGERTMETLTELSRASALISGKEVVEISDVKSLVVPALSHRMIRKSHNGPSTAELLMDLANNR